MGFRVADSKLVVRRTACTTRLSCPEFADLAELGACAFGVADWRAGNVEELSESEIHGMGSGSEPSPEGFPIIDDCIYIIIYNWKRLPVTVRSRFHSEAS